MCEEPPVTIRTFKQHKTTIDHERGNETCSPRQCEVREPGLQATLTVQTGPMLRRRSRFCATNPVNQCLMPMFTEDKGNNPGQHLTDRLALLWVGKGSDPFLGQSAEQGCTRGRWEPGEKPTGGTGCAGLWGRKLVRGCREDRGQGRKERRTRPGITLQCHVEDAAHYSRTTGEECGFNLVAEAEN